MTTDVTTRVQQDHLWKDHKAAFRIAWAMERSRMMTEHAVSLDWWPQDRIDWIFSRYVDRIRRIDLEQPGGLRIACGIATEEIRLEGLLGGQ